MTENACADMTLLLFTLLPQIDDENKLYNPDFIKEIYSSESDSVFIQTFIPTDDSQPDIYIDRSENDIFIEPELKISEMEISIKSYNAYKTS